MMWSFIEIGLICLILRRTTSEDIISRLSPTIQPISYNIDLILSQDIKTFTGDVSITLSIQEPVSEIKIHAELDNIDAVDVKKGTTSKCYVGGAFSCTNTVDPKTNILLIKIPETLLKGDDYVLIITYRSTLRNDMKGFYQSRYIDSNGMEKVLAATQMEPNYARMVFPCFDEPQFKATFTMSVTHPKRFSKVIANTPSTSQTIINDKQARTNFAETPIMSTYLVSFLISEFTCDYNPLLPVPYGVCSQPNLVKLRKYAVDNTYKIMLALENYFDMNYASLGIPKMDLAALPDFDMGAMENWGLVTYRDIALLYDEEQSPNRDCQRVAASISHEFAHTWFGNLVTAHWWSDLFLNEGFARYFQYYILSRVDEYKSWEMEKQIFLETVNMALNEDSDITVEALHHEVTTRLEMENRFKTVTYEKGGSVFRMIHHMIGEQNFIKALRDYMNTYKYKNVKPEDLLSTLSPYAKLPDGVTLTQAMQNWFYQPGYPVLFVKRDGDSVIISQKRFLKGNQNSNTKWYVPISYVLGNKPSTPSTAAIRILKPEENLRLKNVLQGSYWIILNNQRTGFYRVNYDDGLWADIGNALNAENLGGVDELNRAGIVSDALNLAKAGQLSYNVALKVLSFLKYDTSYYSWFLAFEEFFYMLDRMELNSEIHSLMTELVFDLSRRVHDEVDFQKENTANHIFSLKQAKVLGALCSLDHEDCVTEAKYQYHEYFRRGRQPSKNVKAFVYCTAMKYSNDTQLDWQFLWSKYVKATVPSDKNILRQALTCFQDEAILNSLFQIAITPNSGIRKQDASYVFYVPRKSNHIALNFFVQNYEEIKAYFNNPTMKEVITIAKRIILKITKREEVNKISEFAKNLTEDEKPLKRAIDESLMMAEENLAWIGKYEQELMDYLKSNAVCRSAVHLIILIFITLLGILFSN